MLFRSALLVSTFILPWLSFANPLNPGGCNFEEMTAYFEQRLGIKEATIDYVFIKVKNHRTQGYAQQTGKNHYRITLADWLEDSELRVTVAHELVHIRQLQRGEIKQEEFEKHYLERSFEDEAFRLSLPLAADFYTKHKCIDNKH